MAGGELSLVQRLMIGVVPSAIPAFVLIVALGLATAIGELPEPIGFAAEQVAGGALLITYMKELLPRLMEMGNAAVHSKSAGKPAKNIVRTKVLTTSLIVFWMSVSAILQSGADGFPGLLPPKAGEGHEKNVFTPASTIAYYAGFFVDGVCLSYDDNPVRLDKTLVKKMMFSLVFSIDNFLDGFGLVPVLKEAYGGRYWWTVMLAFSACVLLGAICTGCLRHFVLSPMFHVCFLAFATTSILVGALQLCSHGVSVWVMLGIAIVWMVLFVGDLLGEEDEDDTDDQEAPPPLLREVSLESESMRKYRVTLKLAAQRARMRVNSGRFPPRPAAGTPVAHTGVQQLLTPPRPDANLQQPFTAAHPATGRPPVNS